MITVIPNQPIRFRNVADIDPSCECMGQNYCQLVQTFDPTQFQIKSSDLVTNGDFTANLDGWNVFEAIVVMLESIVNPSTGECDGEFEVSVSGGTGPYTYSIDGVTFQATGIFEDLCPDVYTVVVKDADGNEGSLIVNLDENVDCSQFADSTTDDLLTYNTNQFLNCNTDNFI